MPNEKVSSSTGELVLHIVHRQERLIGALVFVVERDRLVEPLAVRQARLQRDEHFEPGILLLQTDDVLKVT